MLPATASPAVPAAERSTEQFVELLHCPVEQAEPQFQQLLGQRLIPGVATQEGVHCYQFVHPQAGQVDVYFDLRRRGIFLRGEARLVAQFASLLQAMESRAQPAQGTDPPQIISLRHAPPEKVRKVLEAIQRTAPAPSDVPPANGGDVGVIRRVDLSVVPVQYLAQAGTAAAAPPAAAPPAAAPPAAAPPPGAEPAAPPPGEPAAEPSGPVNPALQKEIEELRQQQEVLRELGQDVEIETLPDLDVIILRGRGRDLEEITQIINELERISAETRPEVELYQLQHTSADGVAMILSTVAEDLIGGRQGRVHITPLLKPNALLLIGWGDAVTVVRDLIAKLDFPVPPESQFEVFRLKHTTAVLIGGTIQQFYAVRTGLAPRVVAVPDMRTNALVVRAAPRDLAEARALIERLDQPTSDAVNQIRIFKLSNTLAPQLAATLRETLASAGGENAGRSAVLEILNPSEAQQQAIRSGVLADVQVTADAHTNTLIVAGPAESMDLMAALVERLDVPSAVAQIKVFQIANGDANTLVQMFRTLLPSQPGGAQLAGAEGETTLVPARFSVDERTNSIIVTGSPGDLAIVEALLLRLDGEDVQKRKNAVYWLKNAPAPTVAESINEFLRSERVVQAAAPGLMSPFLQIEREVIVVPEMVSNSLIISATPEYFDDIMELVEELDRQPAQVMIQVVIAEVNLSDVEEFGVELGLQDSLLFDRSVVSDGTLDPGYNFNNSTLGNSADSLGSAGKTAGQALTNFSLGRTNSDLGYGGLVLAASSESVSVLIRALKQSQRLDILGRPQIMTLDNQPAFIQVGARVPRISGTRFDGDTQYNTIELENTGLIMGVTPRISPEGRVVMEIDAERSEMAPESEGVPVSVVDNTVVRSPSINVTMAQTTVSAASGETIVLGGLITKNKAKTRRRVPWLADIPVVGNLFRYDYDSDKRNELLIILTPHVVRDAREAEQIKQVEAARMSWCLGDVVDLHGPMGVPGEYVPAGGSTPVIYPDYDIRGEEKKKPGDVDATILENSSLPPPSQIVPLQQPMELQLPPGTRLEASEPAPAAPGSSATMPPMTVPGPVASPRPPVAPTGGT